MQQAGLGLGEGDGAEILGVRRLHARRGAGFLRVGEAGGQQDHAGRCGEDSHRIPPRGLPSRKERPGTRIVRQCRLNRRRRTTTRRRAAWRGG